MFTSDACIRFDDTPLVVPLLSMASVSRLLSVPGVKVGVDIEAVSAWIYIIIRI